MEKQLTCEERVDSEMEKTMEEIRYITGRGDTIRGEPGHEWYGEDEDRGGSRMELLFDSSFLLCVDGIEGVYTGQGYHVATKDQHWTNSRIAGIYTSATEEELESILDQVSGPGSILEDRMGDSEARVIHLQFSWGGPGDGMMVYQEGGGLGWETKAAVYYYQDWGDGASRNVVFQDDLDAIHEIVEALDYNS